MKFVTAQTMREVENRAIAKDIELAQVMMDRAGRGLGRIIHRVALRMGQPAAAVRLLAGPGNNGGDAFVAAQYLHEVGLRPEVWLACHKEKLRGAAKVFFERMDGERIPWREMVGERAWGRDAQATLSPPILVDALMGTGAHGEPLGDIRRGVEYLKSKRPYSLVVAADIPTGMDADTGACAATAVQADLTVTMCLPKAGMAAPAALEALGSLALVSIGLPRPFVDAAADARPDLQLISYLDVRRCLPPRPRTAHKGTFGRALLMGGAARYPGAIVLAAQGAVRSGAGWVRVAAAEAALPAVVARTPEVVAGADLWTDFPLEDVDAILLGPGLGRDPEARRLVARLLRETPCPLVLDADALAMLEGKPEAPRGCAQPVVLTPHPGELARLLGRSVAEIQGDRLAAVREAAERTGAIVALKGAGTLVAQAGQPTWLNLNGNPGMACAGSGDVLAGLLAGLLAQGIDPLEATCAAVWLHGNAGDHAALRLTQPALKAGDIADALPDAFRVATIR